MEGKVHPQRWGTVNGDDSALRRDPMNRAGRASEHRRRATENMNVLVQVDVQIQVNTNFSKS